jgi:hypothetical protein
MYIYVYIYAPKYIRTQINPRYPLQLLFFLSSGSMPIGPPRTHPEHTPEIRGDPMSKTSTRFHTSRKEQQPKTRHVGPKPTEEKRNKRKGGGEGVKLWVPATGF